MNTASFIRRCSQLFAAILSSLLIGNHGYEAFSQEVPVAKPMMVSEAKLPKDFPAPGLVGEVIIKTYPAHRLARVKAENENDNGMFMKLFRHIERNKISMTAPVEMEWSADESAKVAGDPKSMAFLYGSAEIGSTGEDPKDPLVVVEDVAAMQVVSIGLRGGYGREVLDRGLKQLQTWLAANPQWQFAGPPRTLGYNSPFVPNLFKYSEVQIPIAPVP